MQLNRANCQKKYCADRVYSNADWRRHSGVLKQQLREDGVIDFESHPEYVAHVGCKTNINRYYTPNECERIEYGMYWPSPSPMDTRTPTPRTPTPPVRAYYPPPQRDKKSRCKKGTTRNKRTGNCEPTKNKSRFYPYRPSSPVRPSSPKQTNNKPRCKNGTRRNKRTGNCEPTNKSPRQPSQTPGNKKSRCKNGTRRNKRTGNCEPTK